MATEIQPAGWAEAPNLTPSPMPIGSDELIREWEKNHKETTRRGYAKDVADFLKFLSTQAAGTAANLDWYLSLPSGHAHKHALARKHDQEHVRKLSSATIARRLAALKSLCRLAKTFGLVAWTLDVQGPKPEDREDRSGPEDRDLVKLNRASKSGDGPAARRDRAMFVLMAGLGLRRAEVAGLSLADVDYQRGELHVLGKGKREKVPVAVPEEVFAALSLWTSVRGAEPGPLFFRTDRARGVGPPEPLSGEAIRLAVKRLAKAAKVSGPVRPHGLRHSYATRMSKDGETIQAIAAGLRQHSIESTKRYLDTTKADAARLNRKASKLLK